MSYILDALKKSERERSLGHVPTLNTVHSYPKSHASRRWLWLTLLVLVILMLIGVVIYGVMFRSQDDLIQSVIDKSHTKSAGAGHVVAPPKPASRAVPRSSLMNVDPPKQQVNAPKPPSTQAANTAQTSTSYPTIDDLDADVRQRLSDIVVNVVSYSAEPSRRFVMINQKIYRQGQSVNGELAVVEIRPQGAILRFQGREFIAVP